MDLIVRQRRNPKSPFSFFDDDLFSPFKFASTLMGDSSFQVPVDIREDETSINVFADLPGVEKSDLDISVVEDRLIIRGERKSEKSSEAEQGWYFERTHGSFERAITLPTEINLESVSATFHNGVLHVTLPKAQEARAKVKKIQLT